MGKGAQTMISSYVLDPDNIKHSFTPWPLIWKINIGQPSGRRYREGRIWYRMFSGGLVLVNPENKPDVAHIDRSYFLPGQGLVNRISMQPHSATILYSGQNQP